MATMRLALFYCVLTLLQDGTFAKTYHGLALDSLHLDDSATPPVIGWTKSDVDTVQHDPDSLHLDYTTTPPVIGWTKSDVDTVQHDPDSLHLDYTTTPPLIGWGESDVDNVHHNPDSLHLDDPATSLLIGWPKSDVEVIHHAPFSPRNGHIVGGKDADYKKHPYQLQLSIDGYQSCGAAIISSWWAVTAAHCLVDEMGNTDAEDAVTVRAGATYRNTGGRVHSISKIIIHPRYDADEVDYDIALLKVRKPFQFGAQVQKIALPSQGQKVKEGEMAVVSGWGYLTDNGEELSDSLQYVMIPIVNQNKCKSHYMKYDTTITDRMICAGFPKGRKDTCQGDSGGPMVVKDKLVGIVSWGVGCAIPKFPGAYARIPKFRYWIKEHTGV